MHGFRIKFGMRNARLKMNFTRKDCLQSEPFAMTLPEIQLYLDVNWVLIVREQLSGMNFC